jgi:hypothetical protein
MKEVMTTERDDTVINVQMLCEHVHGWTEKNNNELTWEELR